MQCVAFDHVCSSREGESEKVVVDATRNLLMYNLIAATVAAVPNLFTWQAS